MFKKYTIIALGALVLSGQASGMGSWKRFWAPSAVAAASVFTAKTTLCQSDNGKPKGYVDRFKAWVGWNTYGLASSSPIAKSDQMPEHVRQALDKPSKNSDGKYNVKPEHIIRACKECRVPIMGSDRDNWVNAFKGEKYPEAVLMHIRYLKFAAKENSPVGKKRLAGQDVVDCAPCIFEKLLNSEDSQKLTAKFVRAEEDKIFLGRDFSRAQSYESIKTRAELLENLELQERDSVKMSISPRLNEFGRRKYAAEALYARCLRTEFLAATTYKVDDRKDNGFHVGDSDLSSGLDRCENQYAHLNLQPGMAGVLFAEKDRVYHDDYTAEKAKSAIWRVRDKEKLS